MLKSYSWEPSQNIIENANITTFMRQHNFSKVSEFHAWTVQHFKEFWRDIIATLGIHFSQPATEICDLTHGIEQPNWLKGAKLNISDSCFLAATNDTAIYYLENENIKSLSFSDLNKLTNQIANGLIAQGYKAGDVIAIIMPMNYIAIASFLAIIKIGAAVASIPDSFSADEIKVRLKIANAIAIITQDVSLWNGKQIAIYEKVAKAEVKTIIHNINETHLINNTDLLWQQFLSNNTELTSITCNPMDATQILFSSGTTGEPKAILWNHTTAIKAASDAYFHQNIKPHDILAWPTSLGWMMGAWLIYAAFINRAAIALYTDVPKDRNFGKYIERAKVTMLGVVPTLVAAWRQSKCMEDLNWTTIKVFTSTGECSNPDDMRYLMGLAGGKPIIEYCGGTEIGGAYVSSTVVQPNYPSLFSTPTMGLNFTIINDEGLSSNIGEVAIIPPSIGLSVKLINADHHKVYFADMPNNLRRHGDQIERLANGYYRILGRVDDTMNLGGIKISSAEIERAIVGIKGVLETAAIGVTPPNQGPSLLVIFAVITEKLDPDETKLAMQKLINKHLNPLFKIHDLIFCKELPKTASNKIMRRTLRKEYICHI